MGEPDAGTIIAVFEAATGKRTRRVFDKPGPLLATMVLQTIPGPPPVAEVFFVGDRLASDIAMGYAAGVDTAEHVPTWIIETLADLVSAERSR